jgi:hypothetical protein
MEIKKQKQSGQQISLLAARNSWMVLNIGLLVWSLSEMIPKGTLGIPFILLSLNLAVYFGSMLAIRKFRSGDHEGSQG